MNLIFLLQIMLLEKDIVRIIVDISKTAKLVGFSIAEYMPWDIINMRKEFSKIDIFQD